MPMMMILQYQNRTLEAAQVILELIEMAKQIRDLAERGNPLNLNEDVVAFYDDLASHGNVKELMGDKVLSDIAVDLVRLIRQSVSIDWTIKESVRAKMRVQVKKLLRKHGYPNSYELVKKFKNYLDIEKIGLSL